MVPYLQNEPIHLSSLLGVPQVLFIGECAVTKGTVIFYVMAQLKRIHCEAKQNCKEMFMFTYTYLSFTDLQIFMTSQPMEQWNICNHAQQANVKLVLFGILKLKFQRYFVRKKPSCILVWCVTSWKGMTNIPHYVVKPTQSSFTM